MESSDIIATLALTVSLLSVFISYKAFTHSVHVHELETTLAFERDKSELLMQVEKSRNLFAAAKREIENVRYILEHEPPVVQNALHSYNHLFIEFLPKIVGAEKQASMLWDEIYQWRDKSGRSAFAFHTPKFRFLIENDKVVHDSALKCVTELRAKILRAHDEFEQRKLE